MTDRHEFAEDELEVPDDKEDLQEGEEIDLTNLFEDEEISLDEEAIEAIAEKLTLDFEPVKSGNLGMPDSQKQEAYEEAAALNAHADKEEEGEDEIAKEVGKLRESVETLEAEKKGLQESLQTLQSKTKRFEDTVFKLKDALNKTSVQNAKLLYTNEALTSDSLNGRQKAKLVEAISNAKSVEEAKVIFETLQSTVSGSKRVPKNT
jgi:glycerol-3-phosphate dehydrogenase